MNTRGLYMGTTQISPEKTCSEIMQVLVKSGARQIASDYGPGGKINGLRFVIEVQGTHVGFELPVRVDPLMKRIGNRDQAERVAWRQLLRWTQAQMALIEVGMVRAEEVYAPYMLTPDGRTLYQMLTESKFKALPAPQ